MEYKDIKNYIQKYNRDCTFLVVRVYDGVHVDVFKTNEIISRDNHISLQSGESSVGFNMWSVKLTNYGFVSQYNDDGHTYETRVYNLRWTRNLELANTFIWSVINDIDRIKRELEKTYNLLHYEWADRFSKR